MDIRNARVIWLCLGIAKKYRLASRLTYHFPKSLIKRITHHPSLTATSIRHRHRNQIRTHSTSLVSLELINPRFRKRKRSRPRKIRLNARNASPLNLTTALPINNRHLRPLAFLHRHGHRRQLQERRIINSIRVQLAGCIRPEHVVPWRQALMAPAEVPVISVRDYFLIVDQIHPLLGELSRSRFDVIICRRPDCGDNEVVKVLIEEIGFVFEAALLGGLVERGRKRVNR